MRVAQTLAAPREEEASDRDLRLPAISVERPTLCPSSLHQADPFCVVIVSEQIAQPSREPELARLSEASIEAEYLTVHDDNEIGRPRRRPVHALLVLEVRSDHNYELRDDPI